MPTSRRKTTTTRSERPSGASKNPDAQPHSYMIQLPVQPSQGLGAAIGKGVKKSKPAQPAASSAIRKKPNLSQFLRAFAGTGVKIDKAYKPVNINPQQGIFVVRGWATKEARAKAEQKLAGVQFFGDLRIAPAGPPDIATA